MQEEILLWPWDEADHLASLGIELVKKERLKIVLHGISQGHVGYQLPDDPPPPKEPPPPEKPPPPPEDQPLPLLLPRPRVVAS